MRVITSPDSWISGFKKDFEWCKSGWLGLKFWLTLFVTTFLCLPAIKAQTTINLTDEVIARFGVEADLYANINELFPADPDFPNTDDWFLSSTWPTTGENVIAQAGETDSEGNDVDDIIAQLNAGNNSGEIRMSKPIYTMVDGLVWIDAVYFRDQRTNSNLVDETFFTSGNDKNFEDPINGWTIGTGNGGPQKNDIIEFFGHLRRDVGTLPDGNHEFAIVGATTRSQNGTSHLDFEYFRKDIVLNAAGTGLEYDPERYGDLEGDELTEFLNSLGCNRTYYQFNEDYSVKKFGDVVFSVNYESGGDNVAVEVFVWIKRTGLDVTAFNDAENRPFTLSNLAGDFEFYPCPTDTNFGYAKIQPKDESGLPVTAQVNQSTVTGPPWGSFNSKGQPSTDLPALAFVELSLDATELGLDTRSTGGECESPLGSVIVKTRSSAPFESEQKDLAGPVNLGNTPPVTLEIADKELNCTDDYVDLVAEIGPEFETFFVLWEKQDGETWELVKEGYTDEDPTINTLRVFEEDVEGSATYRVTAKIVIIKNPLQFGCELTELATVTEVNIADELEVNCPDDVPLEECSSETDISDAFSDWLGGFSYTGGGGTITETYYVVEGETETETPLGEISFTTDYCEGGSLTVKYEVSDECDQLESCTSTFSLDPDDTNPTASNPDPINVECIEDVPDPDPLVVIDEADNCGEPVVTHLGDESDGETCPETITRTYRVTDACENYIDVTQIITVNDETAPEFETPPADASYQCIEDVPAPGDLTWTDNCDGTGDVTGVDESDGETCPETITRTWSYTDECGNTASVSQTITVNDTEAPEFETPPADAAYQCIEDVPAPGDLTWTDNCDGTGDVTGVDESDGETCPETIIRTWSYTDECGNMASVSQTITVSDTEAPEFETPPADAAYQCAEDVPPAGMLGWTDNCDGAGSVQGTDESDGETCPETIIRTWSYTDECGNMASVSQTITVSDTEAPEFETPPANASYQCADDVPPAGMLGWTDNCDGAGSVQGIDESDGLTCPETITRTWSYTDDCGNMASVSQTITVDDTTDPVVTPPTVADTCNDYPPESLVASWTDNCDGEGTVPANRVLAGSDECSETYTYTFSYTDDCGNTDEETVTIVRETDVVNCETAYGYPRSGGDVSCFLDDGFNNWGWTTLITPDQYTFDLYAGNSTCTPMASNIVGYADVDYSDGQITVDYYITDPAYSFSEVHVWIGETPYPLKNGVETTAPGQYNFGSGSVSGTSGTVGPIDVSGCSEVNIIVHAVTCEYICSCSDTNGNGGGSFGTIGSGESACIDTNGINTSNTFTKSSIEEEISGFSVAPVPFKETVNVRYDFDYTSDVKIQFFDLNGSLLRTFKDTQVSNGDQTQINIDFALRANQVYIIRVETDRDSFSKSIMSAN